MENFVKFSTFNDDDDELNIDLDELYERKRINHEMKMTTFRKILKRIITKIKVSSRKYPDHQYIYYEVPQFIMGHPRYSMEDIIEYLTIQLQEQNFLVKYIHPHILFITWYHYIPYHERLQYKMKTGITIDAFGNVIGKNKNNNNDDEKKEIKKQKIKYDKDKKIYKRVDEFKPTGLYSKELIEQMQKKARE